MLPSMGYALHVLTHRGELAPHEAAIRKIVEDTYRKVAALLTLAPVDIVVLDQPRSVIPETGLGGYAPNRNLLYVYADSRLEDFDEILEDELPSTLAHELHHCARWNTVGYGHTLLTAMVSEGLADHFDVEVTGREPLPWCTAFSASRLDALLERARPDLDNPAYDHDAWFFGAPAKKLPRWAGYSLGFRLVADRMERTGITASGLADAPAHEFLPGQV